MKVVAKNNVNEREVKKMSVEARVKIKGDLRMSGVFEVELDMTKEEFEALSLPEQKDLIDENLDWLEYIIHAGADFNIKEMKSIK